MPEATQAPRHGFVHIHGRRVPVHQATMDHLPAASPYQRFNKRVAVRITQGVGSMTCAYVFTCISLVALPAVLYKVSRSIFGFFPHWLVSASLIALVAWVAAYFLQLVLLPIIIVGQNVQAEASDARAAKAFSDTEAIVDALDLHSVGGLQSVYAAIRQLAEAQGITLAPLDDPSRSGGAEPGHLAHP